MKDGVGQTQFLALKGEEEARQLFGQLFGPGPLGEEEVALEEALGRVTAQPVASPVDVPAFDRANLDGFAVRAEDTFHADEAHPALLALTGETLACGVAPQKEVGPGQASAIATGGMMPRGADAVVMVENSRPAGGGQVALIRPVTPGEAVTYAGADLGAGERLLGPGVVLSSRETALLAAVGIDRVRVVRRPRVGVVSTGNEIVAPGQPLPPGGVYDANGRMVADALRELGAVALAHPPVKDDEAALEAAIGSLLAQGADAVVLSGGTSKGAGDVNFTVAEKMGRVVLHGVALKPGKPLCLAQVQGRPLVVLPGFPTSALFTFKSFVAPCLRSWAGLPPEEEEETLAARLPQAVKSERGRTEYLLVNLLRGDQGLAAYPAGKGSGSVSAYARADGFIRIPRGVEWLEAGEPVKVYPMSRGGRPADLVVAGSHCLGLDYLLAALSEAGWRVKFLPLGSSGGLEAARRGECDLAALHLLHPSGVYNAPYLDERLRLVKGYTRLQGVCCRAGDPRLAQAKQGETYVAAAYIAAALADGARMVNRNRGSGTRVLLDGLLGQARPPGFFYEVKTHNAAAAAVAQKRADWGVAIRPAAERLGLAFLPLGPEEYDFAIPAGRLERPAVKAFLETLALPASRAALAQLGF